MVKSSFIGDYDDYDSQIKFSYRKEDGTIEKRPAFTYFKYVVPGDVVAYSGHVMMVDKVAKPEITEDGKLYWEDTGSIEIIESVFNNGSKEGCEPIFGVGNNRNLKMVTQYNNTWKIWRQK